MQEDGMTSGYECDSHCTILSMTNNEAVLVQLYCSLRQIGWCLALSTKKKGIPRYTMPMTISSSAQDRRVLSRADMASIMR